MNKKNTPEPEISEVIGRIPYRMAFAGGWIDQPFISCRNPSPPGSMVVISLEPTFHFMEFCGMGTSTRKTAMKIWNGSLPDREPEVLMRELYNAENAGSTDPSGSQDMAGIIFPGISRLDFDYAYDGGLFPVHVESNNDPGIASWLEEVIHVIPVAQRPHRYSPLGIKNLDPDWIAKLGESGKNCYQAILDRDAKALGASMNACMTCWEIILPHVVKHPSLMDDMLPLLQYYQNRYAGAMFSGCGGGYFYVVSEKIIAGAIKIKLRINQKPSTQ